MCKKILSMILTVMMIISVVAIPATAVQVEIAENSADAGADTSADNTISFDTRYTGWNNFKKVFCHVWAYDGSGEWLAWQSKKEACSYDSATGIATYDLSKTGNVLADGELYAVIFSNENGMQTYSLLFGTECIGDTAYCDGTTYENPEDSSKTALAAFWKRQDRTKYGPELCITSIGNVVGTCMPFTTSAYAMFVDFLTSKLLNAQTYSGKDDQTLLDDTADALGLYVEDVEEAIRDARVNVSWSASKSSLPASTSSDESTGTRPSVPGYPPGIQVDGPVINKGEVTNSGVKLSWNFSMPSRYMYRIFVKNGSTWERLATVSSSTSSYVDTTVKTGNSYTYTIRCVDTNGNYVSDYDSRGYTINVLDTPKNVKFVNTGNGAVLSWPQVYGAEKYRVYIKDGSSWTKLADTDYPGYTHRSVANSKSYTYTVRCISYDLSTFESGYNTTGFSNTYVFVGTPVISKGEVNNSGIKITWEKVAGAENYKYRLFVRSGSSWETLATVSGNTSSYVDNTARSTNTYTYTLRCVDNSGKYISDFDSEGYTIRMLETPKNISFENNDSGIKISWPQVQGAEKYRVYVRKGDSWSKLADTDSTSYTHISVAQSQSYTYTVRCISSDLSTFESGFNSTGFTTTYMKPEVKFENGDVDGDKQVSVMDATAIQLHQANIKILTSEELARADADKDGAVSVMDSTQIQMFLADLIPSL